MSTGKKKILYVITKSNMGGAQRYVFDLATSLPKDTYDVTVAFGGNGLLAERLHKAGIQTATIKSFERDINMRKEIFAFFELFTLMRTIRPDIVHLNSSKAGGTGALVARLCGVKNIIFTAHGWPFYEKRSCMWRTLIWFLSYLTALLSHRIIVVSEHDNRKAHMPGLTRKIVKIHTALPPITHRSKTDARTALFEEEIIKKHSDKIWVVSTGELTQNKNIGMLIEAIAKLPSVIKNQVFLTIIGDGELRKHLESLVRTHTLQEQVHFLGFIPEVRTLLTAFDIFVMPSQKEGFPYGLLEAGAAGLAVIASTVGGIPEIVEHKKTGLLMPSNEIHELVSALTTLIENKEMRGEIGQKLIEKVSTEFALKEMTTKTITLYENGSRAS